MKVGIIGNYGATNIGDEAILTAMIKSLSDHKITVFSADYKKTSVEYGIDSAPLFPLGLRSFFKNGFRRSIKALKKTDIVILGGGGLFQDNHLYACLLWAWQVFWVTWFKKPLIIYGTGVGPLKTAIGKRITKWAYEQADLIAVRDEYSRDLLHKIGVSEQDIYITSDPVFIYNRSDIAKERAKNLFVISIRPWLGYNSKIIDSFVPFLEKLKAEKNAEFIFVCMQQIREHDHKVIDPIMKKVGGELFIPKHFSDLIEMMRTAEFAIGMRYHFLMSAIITGTPVIPVSYSPKVDELFADTPLSSYVIPVGELSADVLENRLKRLSVDYNNVKIYERTRCNHLNELAKENAVMLDDFIKTFDQKQFE